MKDELVELQEKLDGVYDLTDVVDCQSVIRMLLGDLKREKLRTENTRWRLNKLVELVIDSKGCESDVKDYARGVKPEVSKTGNGSEKHDVIGYLAKMNELIKTVSCLDDEQLIDEAIGAWSKINTNSCEAAAIEELIERYREVKGVKNVMADKMPSVP